MHNKVRATLGATVAATMLVCAVGTPAFAADTTPMYRLYNQWSGEHLFTTNAQEYQSLAAIGWNQEGEAWESPSEGYDVYRLYNSYSGDHFYTGNKAEYDHLGSVGWNQEGVAFKSVSEPGSNASGHAIYRLYNPYVTVGTHLFTTDEGEYLSLIGQGWRGEAVAFTAESVPQKTAAQAKNEKRMDLAVRFTEDYISNTKVPSDINSGLLSSSEWVNRVRAYYAPSIKYSVSADNYSNYPQTATDVHVTQIEGNIYTVSYHYVNGQGSGTAEICPTFDDNDLIYAIQ